MAKRPFKNKLNDLDPKCWLLFQKSWFVHNPPRRRKDVLLHPAKFPETLAQEFIEFFTKKGQVVLDPMAGTGSTLIAALRSERNSYGIELNDKYIEVARKVILDEWDHFGLFSPKVACEITQGNAANISEIVRSNKIPEIDYVITSPPYWDMLHSRGAATQKKRRIADDLDVVYSDDPDDLGNIHDYPEFLSRLTEIYVGLEPFLRPGAYLTIIVKNIKKAGRIYPLAWDLARNLSDIYLLKDERIWCQDDIRLAPYGMGNAWVSNTFHHYCLQFRKK